MKTIIIATPHRRNDAMVEELSRRLSDYHIVRCKSADELTLESLAECQPEWIFFPHWSWIVPDLIFEKYRCVIFHMTDLPYGRGGSPLQNLIIRGHKTTKLSALKCVNEVDAGPIYMKRVLDLSGRAEDILQRASVLMIEMIIEIVRDKPEAVEQEGDVVLFERRKPADSDLSGLQSLGDIYDHIRMLDAEGYPAAFLEQRGVVYEFFDAKNEGKSVSAKVRIKRRDSD